MINNILHYKYIKYKNKYINQTKYEGGSIKSALLLSTKCDIKCIRCKKNIRYKNNIFLSNCMHICCRTCLFTESIYLLDQKKHIYIIYLINSGCDTCICGKSIKQYKSLIGDTWIINNFEHHIIEININNKCFNGIMYKHELETAQQNFIENYKNKIELTLKFFILQSTILQDYRKLDEETDSCEKKILYMRMKIKYLYTLTKIINGTFIVNEQNSTQLCVYKNNHEKDCIKLDIDRYIFKLHIANRIARNPTVNNIGYPIDLLPDIKYSCDANFTTILDENHIEPEIFSTLLV